MVLEVAELEKLLGNRGMVTIATSLTLEAFLQLPETKPATELIDGQVNWAVFRPTRLRCTAKG